MTNSPEAIATAREILNPAGFYTVDELASIIQKHYAAKDGELETLRATDLVWARKFLEINQERDQLKSRCDYMADQLQLSGHTSRENLELKARVAELEKAIENCINSTSGNWQDDLGDLAQVLEKQK